MTATSFARPPTTSPATSVTFRCPSCTTPPVIVYAYHGEPPTATVSHRCPGKDRKMVEWKREGMTT